MSDLIEREQALKALEEISYALWEIDIPSPTVPEYIEHHEGVQSVMKVADRWARKIMALPSEEKIGNWIFNPRDGIEAMFTKPKCSVCGFESADGLNYCPNCGARMEGWDGQTQV